MLSFREQNLLAKWTGGIDRATCDWIYLFHGSSSSEQTTTQSLQEGG
jgi:hypothetical protein